MDDAFKKAMEAELAFRRVTDAFRASESVADHAARSLRLAAGIPPSTADLLGANGNFQLSALNSALAADRSLTSSILGSAADARVSLGSNLDLVRLNAALAGVTAPSQGLHSALAFAAQSLTADQFRTPYVNEIARLAEFASNSALTRAAFGADLSSLQTSMEAMRSPWLSATEGMRSALGFGELQAIGALLRMPPFEQSVSTALRADLGDWREAISLPVRALLDPVARSEFYSGLGFNRALTNFTPEAFDESLHVAGLADGEVGEQAGADEESGFARNRAAFDRLQRFETEVRRFIDKVMRSAFGDEWVTHRTPAGMKGQWVEKKHAAVAKGEAPRPLIDYADFTDYKAIIERRDNWRDVFEKIFKRPEDVRESFQRLFPVRICTMHARIITLDDELYVASETTRILRAIRLVEQE
jgi:hypothetical protein